MSKNNIAQQYNSMVASIEDAKIYDGRGEYNLYECNKCNNYKVTLYKDKGVTPFIMRCKCGGYDAYEIFKAGSTVIRESL